MKHIVDLSEVRFIESSLELQRNFTKATGIAALLVDARGEPVTAITGCSSYYTLLLRSGPGAEQCWLSVRKFCTESRETGRLVSGICPFTGLLQAFIPLRADACFCGGWIIGQARQHPVERPPEYYTTFLASVSAAIGLHSYPLKKLMSELTQMSGEAFGGACCLLETAAKALMPLNAKAPESQPAHHAN